MADGKVKFVVEFWVKFNLLGAVKFIVEDEFNNNFGSDLPRYPVAPKQIIKIIMVQIQ